MCKVMMMTALKPETVEKAKLFSRTIGRLMSRINDDGLGYAAIGQDGELFGERWLKNDTAWNSDAPELSPSDKRVNDAFPGLTKIETPTFEYNSFGKVDLNNMVAITLHTRAATSPKGLKNTHPFVDGFSSVIHNGVINNHATFDLKSSTCDSEAILVSYVDNEVYKSMKHIKHLANDLEGYYVCGVLSRDGKDNPIMDIFKSGGQLHFAYVNDLETYVFSTSEQDIKDACEACKFTHEKVYEFTNETYLRLDPYTGAMIDMKKFSSRVRSVTNYPGSHYQSQHRGSTVYNSDDTKNKKEEKGGGMSQDLIDFMLLKVGIEDLGEVSDIQAVVGE